MRHDDGTWLGSPLSLDPPDQPDPDRVSYPAMTTAEIERAEARLASYRKVLAEEFALPLRNEGQLRRIATLRQGIASVERVLYETRLTS